MPNTKGKWIKIGESITSPVGNTTRKEVFASSSYGLTVGFEVNNPDAFVNDVLTLDKDTGHAFFYLTQDSKVLNFFSFGPNGAGEPGKIIDQYTGERPGTPDYQVEEPVKLFRLKLTKAQSDGIDKETDRIRKEITSGRQKYTAYVNDTCAETARDIIKQTIPRIPDGAGVVTMRGNSSHFAVVNPYMWHKNFKAKYKEISKETLVAKDLPKIKKGSIDPVAGKLFEDIT